MGELPLPAEENETIDDGRNKRRRRFGFAEVGESFLSFLQRVRSQQEAEHHAAETGDDEEDETDETGFSKKARRFFRRVFGRVVPPPPVVIKPESRQESSAVPSSEQTQPPAALQQEQAASMQGIPAEANKPATGTVDKQEDTPSNTEDNIKTPDKSREVQEYSSKTDPALHEVELPTAGEFKGTEQTINIGHEDLPPSNLPESGERRLPPASPPPIEHLLRSSPTPERVLAHDGGARALAAVDLALIGAEYVGRKRGDSNLEKRTDKKLAGLKQEMQQSQHRIERVEQKAASTQRSAERLDLWQQAFEAPLPRPQSVTSEKKPPSVQFKERPYLAPAEARNSEPRSGEVSKDKYGAEKLERVQKLADRKKPTVEKLLHPIESLATPQAVLEEVEEAAAKNIPLEKLFEKRQEIKDVPGDLPVAAAAGGAVVTQSTSPQLSLAQSALADSNDNGSSRQNLVQLLRDTPQYRQAAVNGVWGAVLVLLVLAVISVV